MTTQQLPEAGKGRRYFVQGYTASFDEVLAEAQRIDGEEEPWTIRQAPGAVEETRDRRQEPSEAGVVSWVSASISEGLTLRKTNDNKSVGFKTKYGFR